MDKKGQGMAIDLMAGVLIFIVIGGSIMFVWGDKAFEAEERLFENERIAMAERTLNTMIRSKGLPLNWEDEDIQDIQMLGLAKRDRVLDTEKVEKFVELSNLPENYAILKTKLLIGGNEYYFRILDPKSEGSGQIISAGISLEDTSLQGNIVKIRIERPVIYTYHREGKDEEGEKNQHAAIAELTLYSTYYWRA